MSKPRQASAADRTDMVDARQPLESSAPSRRIRVCHVVVRPLLDGAQRSMLDLCCNLDVRRYKISVICAAEGPLTKLLRET